MIALVLGGSSAVWKELESAKRLLNGKPHLVVAANLAGVHYRGRLDGLATYHSDLIGSWVGERVASGLNTDFRRFTPTPANIPTERVPEDWDGSSGLFATRCALFHMGASGAILCGVPLEREAGHFINPGQWASVTTYRQEWQAVAPLIGDRVRSMGGWTATNFGHPDAAWIAAHT